MNVIVIALSLIAVVVAFATRKEFMNAIERLHAGVQKLNETIVTEAAQMKAAIENLRDEINNNGADSASLSRIADELEASIDRVSKIVPDEPADGNPPANSDSAIAASPDAVDIVSVRTELLTRREGITAQTARVRELGRQSDPDLADENPNVAKNSFLSHELLDIATELDGESIAIGNAVRHMGGSVDESTDLPATGTEG